MRILICASDAPLPPLTTGYRRQLTGLISELGRRHDVKLVGYRMPEQRRDPELEERMTIIPYLRPGVTGNVRDLALATIRREPIRAGRYARGLRRALRAELESFQPDVVHVGPGKLAGLLDDLDGRPAVLGVMDTWHLNVEARRAVATGLRAAVLRRDVRAVQRFEATRYRGWDRVIPSNRDDCEVLKTLDPTLPMTIIPIGFDASAFAPDSAAIRDSSRVVFHGAMNYPPNIECAEFLAREVMPLVRARRPDAHLALVGRDPHPRVRALAALDFVEVTGMVDDLRRWLLGSQVWAGPFVSGTGIKTKVLEAMATDLPCVVTRLGARGLDDAGPGELLVGETKEALANHVVYTLRHAAFARRLGEAGGRFARGRYDWPVVGRAFEEVYEEVVQEKARVRVESAAVAHGDRRLVASHAPNVSSTGSTF